MEKIEMESLVKQLKAAGLNEDQIMETFYETFQEGKMDRKDLEACAEFMGYELTDDFKNDPTPDPIAQEGAEGITKEEAEAAKEIKPGESPEEFKEAVTEEAKEENPAPAPEGGEPAKSEEPKPEAKPEAKPEGKEEELDEDKEWEEVQKKFNWQNATKRTTSSKVMTFQTIHELQKGKLLHLWLTPLI